jgi:hypothetical protein
MTTQASESPNATRRATPLVGDRTAGFSEIAECAPSNRRTMPTNAARARRL